MLMVQIQLVDWYGQIVDGIDFMVKATREDLPILIEWAETEFGKCRAYGLEPKVTIYC